MLFRSRQNRDHGLVSEDDGDMAEINIIPLVDVMLVLLIIFMVAAPLSISGIRVDLPKSAAKGTTVDENRIVLSVSGGGEFFVDKVNVPSSSLVSKLKAIYQYRQKKELYIRADRAVTYGRVVEAMSAAKLAGVTKIAMLTQPLATAAAPGMPAPAEQAPGKKL
jgi:biopolymer transport protein TolR